MNTINAASSITTDFENDNVFLTHRAKRCRAVPKKRSTRLVCPALTTLSSSGMTSYTGYASVAKPCASFSVSEPGIASHSLKNVFWLRSPNTQATTLEVPRSSATHNQTGLALRNTNVQSSSISSARTAFEVVYSGVFFNSRAFF